jgi:hypothetical protein
MALIPCYECSREISDKAPACPQCGAPKKKSSAPKKKAAPKKIQPQGALRRTHENRILGLDFSDEKDLFIKALDLAAITAGDTLDDFYSRMDQGTETAMQRWVQSSLKKMPLREEAEGLLKMIWSRRTTLLEELAADPDRYRDFVESEAVQKWGRLSDRPRHPYEIILDGLRQSLLMIARNGIDGKVWPSQVFLELESSKPLSGHPYPYGGVNDQYERASSRY